MYRQNREEPRRLHKRAFTEFERITVRFLVQISTSIERIFGKSDGDELEVRYYWKMV